MATFLITKSLTAYLTVDCKDIEETRAWEGRLVATLEDEDGNPIPADAIDDFEADCYLDAITVELLSDDGARTD